MKKAIQALRDRYFIGSMHMIDQGLPAITYVACVIATLLVLCHIDPNNAKVYAVIMGVNVVGTYLLAYIGLRYDEKLMDMQMPGLLLRFVSYFIFLTILVSITSNYIELWKAKSNCN